MARTKAGIPDPKPPIDLEEARRLRRLGHSYADIGRELGYRASSIRRRLLENGVRTRPPTSHRARKWGDKLYSSWKGMRRRCHSTSHPQYASVGGRGISMCQAWEFFEAFYEWATSSGYRPGLVLLRKNQDRGFEPRNCRWGGRSELSRKKPRPDRRSRGRALTEAQWKRAERLHQEDGLSCPQVAKRIGVAHGSVLRGLKSRGSYIPASSSPATGTVGRKISKSWYAMHSRCTDANDEAYAYYGAKGARVCKEWEEFESFHRWALDSGWMPGLCLTRKGRAKVFSPRNCVWVTRAEAARNADHPSSKMPARWTVTAFGETKGPTEWSRDARCSVTLAGLLQRLRKGWDVESAISEAPATGAGPPSRHLLSAFGTTKGVADWVRDRRCKVTLVTLIRRLERGIAPEDAITNPPYGGRSLSQDLR